jgi:hypothetical protein
MGYAERRPSVATPRSLQQPHYEIAYLPGAANVVADALCQRTTQQARLWNLRKLSSRLTCRYPPRQHNDATPHILCDTRSQGTPPKAVLFTLHNVGDSKNLTPDPTEQQTRPGNQTTFQALRRRQTSKTTPGHPPRSK